MPGAGLLRCHWSSPKKMIHQRGSQLERLNHCASSQGRFEFETFCSRLSIRNHMKSDRFIDNGEWKTKLCQTTTVTTNHPQLQVWEAIWNVIFCTIEASLDSTESDDWFIMSGYFRGILKFRLDFSWASVGQRRWSHWFHPPAMLQHLPLINRTWIDEVGKLKSVLARTAHSDQNSTIGS